MFITLFAIFFPPFRSLHLSQVYGMIRLANCCKRNEYFKTINSFSQTQFGALSDRCAGKKTLPFIIYCVSLAPAMWKCRHAEPKLCLTLCWYGRCSHLHANAIRGKITTKFTIRCTNTVTLELVQLQAKITRNLISFRRWHATRNFRLTTYTLNSVHNNRNNNSSNEGLSSWFSVSNIDYVSWCFHNNHDECISIIDSMNSYRNGLENESDLTSRWKKAFRFSSQVISSSSHWIDCVCVCALIWQHVTCWRWKMCPQSSIP